MLADAEREASAVAARYQRVFRDYWNERIATDDWNERDPSWSPSAKSRRFLECLG